MKLTADIVIVGSGVAGLFAALNLPQDKNIIIITKSSAEQSDSFLAQGGICMLANDEDYGSYFEDTMRAGHYENDPETVEIMIRSSQSIISSLIDLGVEFEKNSDGSLKFTREGAHSSPRICFHEDITGKEITSKLLSEVKKRKNIKLFENLKMIDITEHNSRCTGIIARYPDSSLVEISARFTLLATGGIGGLFHNSTNYPHLTADALAIAKKHGVKLKNLDYIQIHPTTLYSKEKGRRFLISESVRGEGAVLLDKNMQRFTNELQPRDKVSEAIFNQMEKDGTEYVWLSMRPIDKDVILNHFPHIYKRCLEEGYDATKECIPVVPAQHYFMGGIEVDCDSKTSMECLYAAGETSCNGVHGKNRLASNSLLESLVFAKRAAEKIASEFDSYTTLSLQTDLEDYTDCDVHYEKIIKEEIERIKKENE